MQRIEHDLIPELIAERPASILDLVRDTLGIELAPRDAVVAVTALSRQVSQLVPPELACDCAVRVELADGGNHAVLVEVQAEIDREKELVWPLYWAAMRRQIDGGSTTLIAITFGPHVERWARGVVARVIPAEGRAFVLGPSNTPLLTDPDLGRTDPQAVVLSALVHAGQPGDEALVPALTETLSTIEDAHGRIVYDLLGRRLSKAARQALESFMSLIDRYEWQSDFALRHIAQGRSEGRREQLVRSILSVLDVRGIACTEDVRAQLDACADTAMLEAWLRRAVTATAIDDVFTAR